MKHKEPLSVMALYELRDNKIYRIYYKNGYVYNVRINKTDGSKLYGTTKSVIARDASGKYLFSVKDEEQKPFVHEYKEIIDNSNKVTRWGFDIPSTLIIICNS